MSTTTTTPAPTCELSGLRWSIGDNPVVMTRSVELVVTLTSIKVDCTNDIGILKKWIVRETGSGDIVYSMEGKMTLRVPPNTLGFGHHSLQLTVEPVGMPDKALDITGSVDIAQSPLIASVVGGAIKSVPEGQMLVVDASLSTDPDVPINSGLEYTWDCKTADYNDDDGVVSPTGNDCRAEPSSNPFQHTAVLQIEATKLRPYGAYHFIVVVTKDTRRADTSQTQVVLSQDTPQITVMCLTNCGTRVIASRELRLGATVKCTSCDNLQFMWQAFKLIDGTTMEQMNDLDNLAVTGITSKYLVIKPNVLTPAGEYQFKLVAGRAFSVYSVTVNRVPTGGTCGISPNTGEAWLTMFSVDCSGWYDPDDGNGGTLGYTISSVSLGQTTPAKAVYETSGSKLTKELMFDEGLADSDYKINVIFEVTDSDGASVSHTVEIQVTPVKATVAEMLESDAFKNLGETDVIGAFRITGAILDKSDSTGESTVVTAEEVQMKEQLAELVMSATQNLESPVACAAASDALSTLASKPEALSDKAKENCANSIVNALTGQLNVLDKTSSESSQAVAHKILGAVDSLLNIPDVSECTADCDATQSDEKLNSQLYSSIKMLSAIAMHDTVPGEGKLTFSSDKLTMEVTRQDAAQVSNAVLGTNHMKIQTPDLGDLDIGFIVDVELLQFKKNPFPSGDVKSELIGLTLLNNGKPQDIKDTEEPFIITIPTPASEQTEAVPVNITVLDLLPQSNMSYAVDLDSFNVTSVILFDEVTGCDQLLLFASLNQQPDDVNYDITTILPQEQFEFDDDRRWKVIMDLSTWGVTPNTSGNSLNLLVIPKGAVDDMIEFNINIFLTSCMFRNELTNTWDVDGCRVSDTTTPSNVECACSHLTLFASNWIVPPNKIDFSTVFDNIDEKILDNIHVIITIGLVLGVYVILVIVLRRYDIKDLLKWRITPLQDNGPEDHYRYLVTVFTGSKKDAGTKSNVFFALSGEYENTEVRKLEGAVEKSLDTGSVNSYILSTSRWLGPLLYLRTWHDNTGLGGKASWFLDRVVIKDLHTDELHLFLCQQWLAVEKGDGQIDRVLPAAGKEDMEQFDYLFYSTMRDGLTDDHIWFSLLSRPVRSNFTRVQRLSACLALLFATMIANAMWYKADDNIEGVQVVHLGPFTFTPQQAFISIVSSLVSLPITMIIVTLFRKARPRHNIVQDGSEHNDVRGPGSLNPTASPSTSHVIKDLHQFIDKDNRCKSESKDALASIITGPLTATNKQESKPSLMSIIQAPVPPKKRKPGATKQGCQLPWWTTIIAWILVVLVVAGSATFTILYSFEWGGDKSSAWLVAFLLSFVESVLLIQPLKVIGIALIMALILKSRPSSETQDAMLKENQELSDHGYNWTKPEHRCKEPPKGLDQAQLDFLRKKRQKEIHMWSLIREVMSHTIYVIVIFTLTYENRDPASYRTREMLDNMFVVDSMDEILTLADYWKWTREVMIPQLYPEKWYNQYDLTWRDKQYVEGINYYRVGSPRLRQARVDVGDCQTPKSVNNVRICYPYYDMTTYQKHDYIEAWATNNNTNASGTSPWTYQTSGESESYPVWGRLDIYGGGGYISVLGPNADEAQKILSYLEQNQWIDRGTRAIIAELTMFNPSTNLFSVLNLILETPPTGGATPWSDIRTMRLYFYSGNRALFRLLLEAIVVIFIGYFIYVEVKEFIRDGRRYFKDMWNFLEVANIILALVCCGMHLVHYLVTRSTLQSFQKDTDGFTSFQKIVYWDDLLGCLLGALVFVAMMKMLKILRFSKKVTEFISTLSLSKQSIFGFICMFTLLFGAFSQFFYIIYGRLLLNYSTFVKTSETLFSMMMKRFSYEELVEQDKILGPMFFFLYVLFVGFVVMQILVSVLNADYSTVKKGTVTSSDYEMIDFIMEQFKKAVGMDVPVVNTSSRQDSDPSRKRRKYKKKDNRPERLF